MVSVGVRAVVVSAPWGNYVRPEGSTPTVGTFTLRRRRGRAWRVLRTVRCYPRLGAWVNRIGLRNPGIGWLESAVRSGRKDLGGSILSVHGFDEGEWAELVDRAGGLGAAALELNISCPNVGEVSWPTWLFERAVSTGTVVVVKLPPVNYVRLAEEALSAGVRWLHCCNTLPVRGGGMSGKPLQPLSLRCVEEARTIAGRLGVSASVIGGGGVTGPEDVRRYADAGADRVALGTKLMHPRYLARGGRTRADLGPIFDEAERCFGG